MRRMLTRTGLLLALVVALTGCIKIDEDLTVRKDGKVDGTAIIAFSKEFVGMMEGLSSSMDSGSKSSKKSKSFEEQLKNPDPPKGLPAGATAKTTFYKQGDWIGNKITFKGVPADKLDELDTTSSAATGGSSSNDGQTFSLKREGKNWHFTMIMDMSSGAGETTTTVKGQKPATTKKGATTTAPALDMSAMFANMKADIRIKVSFPGKVIKSNGKVKGNSVTWTPEMGKRVVMDAVAQG